MNTIFSGETHRPGRIEVVCGSMFSGKTEELIRRMKRAKFAKQKVEIFKQDSKREEISSKLHLVIQWELAHFRPLFYGESGHKIKFLNYKIKSRNIVMVIMLIIGVLLVL